MKKVQDHFSELSEGYQKYRPNYPRDLYETIFSQCHSFNRAWDCGTGNGQAAIVLAEKFNHVYATDISDNQLNLAKKKDTITYSNQRAEDTNFDGDFFDLVCVAQAAHWFDSNGFNSEVNRVLKQKGVLAIWGYDLVRVNPKIDSIVDHFYTKVVGSYWTSERKSIEQHYQDLHVSLEELSIKNTFEYSVSWTLEHFIGYISSWSAVKNYINAQGQNPTIQLKEKLAVVWEEQERPVVFPIFLRLFKKGN